MDHAFFEITNLQSTIYNLQSTIYNLQIYSSTNLQIYKSTNLQSTIYDLQSQSSTLPPDKKVQVKEQHLGTNIE